MNYPQDFINKVICGDCLEILSQIPDESVDMIFIDPPYNISNETVIHRSRNPMKYKYVGKDIKMIFGEWDIFDTAEDFFKFTEQWFNESIRILKPNGHIISFFDKVRISYLYELGEKLGISRRQPLFWIKSNPVPCARKINFMNSVEMMYWGTKFTEKKTDAIFNYKLGQHRDYIECPIPQKQGAEKRHPTQKPLDLARWLISYLTNKEQIVIDFFVGYGTVPVVCKELNRKYIVIDISSECCEITRKRLTNITRSLF